MAIEDVIGVVGGIAGVVVAVSGSILAIWTAVTNRRDRKAEAAKPKEVDPVVASLRDALAHARKERDWWREQWQAERAGGETDRKRLEQANLALSALGKSTF